MLRRLAMLIGCQVACACRTRLDSGDALEARLMQEAADGQRLIVSTLFMSPDEAFASCQKRLDVPDRGVVGSVLAYDGYINLPSFRTDAVVCVGRWHAADLRLSIAVPYRHAAKAGGLALFSPRVLESSVADSYLPVIEEGFFAGIDSFEPSGLWTTHLDENERDNLEARRCEQEQPLILSPSSMRRLSPHQKNSHPLLPRQSMSCVRRKTLTIPRTARVIDK